MASLDKIDRPIKNLADTLQQLQSGKPAYFSWRALISGDKPPIRAELRHLILVGPEAGLHRRWNPAPRPATPIRQAGAGLQGSTRPMACACA